MRRIEIEGWALKVADSIKHGRPVEDARVEIKSTWPEAKQGARRIAGHANAAHGEPDRTQSCGTFPIAKWTSILPPGE